MHEFLQLEKMDFVCFGLMGFGGKEIKEKSIKRKEEKEKDQFIFGENGSRNLRKNKMESRKVKMKRIKLKEGIKTLRGLVSTWSREGFNAATARTKELPVALPNQSTHQTILFMGADLIIIVLSY